MCVFVCVSVTKVVIVDNGQSIRFFVFLYKIEYGSEESKSRRTSKFHDPFKRYDNFNNVFGS